MANVETQDISKKSPKNITKTLTVNTKTTSTNTLSNKTERALTVHPKTSTKFPAEATKNKPNIQTKSEAATTT